MKLALRVLKSQLQTSSILISPDYYHPLQYFVHNYTSNDLAIYHSINLKNKSLHCPRITLPLEQVYENLPKTIGQFWWILIPTF